MALERLPGDRVWRFYLASLYAFEDWENPTLAELNANPNNNPDGAIFNLSCALNTDGTTFDLGDPETDDSLTFCQRAGTEEILSYSPEVVFQSEHSTERWIESDPTTLNDANLALSLLRWRGVEYWAILSIGEDPEAPFEAGHEIKMAHVATDHGIDEHDSGSNILLTQSFLQRGNLLWNRTLTA